MKVILLSDIKGIGRRYEEKDVSDGYARNFLIPKKLAVPADESVAGEVKAKIDEEKKAKERNQTALERDISNISGTEISIKERANEKGHLFSGITTQKLSEILKREKGLNIDASRILLEAPIKEIGTYKIGIKTGEKIAHFSLKVEALS